VPCLLFHTIRGYEMREKAGMLSAVDARNLNTGSHGQLNRYRCRDMQLGLECGILRNTCFVFVHSSLQSMVKQVFEDEFAPFHYLKTRKRSRYYNCVYF